MSQNFVIYKSSAGSGKTYTLTKEYLKIALKYPNNYKHILAVTFTNKAMQEMKNRIIEKLDEFSNGKFDDMAEELIRYTGFEKLHFQTKCKEVLTNILHGYSHFSISTIDAFFQKVIRSFAKELGLAGSYKLELNQDIILLQIVDDLLLDATDNKEIRDWLVEFARENLQDDKSWDVRTSIKQLAQEIFREHFKPIEAEIKNRPAEQRNLAPKLKKELNEIIHTFENKMDKLSQTGLAILEKHNLQVNDFAYGNNSAVNYLNNIKSENKKYAPGKRLSDSLSGNISWYTKTSKLKDEIDSALADNLEATIASAVDYYDTAFPHYNTAAIINKFIYSYGLLADLSQKLQQYKEENDVMLVSDATSFLKELIQDADTPFVYEKVGSFYKHYLIDEFQDTSGFQWDSFRPLIEDSLAQGYKNLVVGDIKQSIYRWRGGDWELLLNKIEKDIGSHQTFVDVLDTNFRSAANIISFNNKLFSALPKTLMQEANEDYADDWQVLDAVYEDIVQETPEAKAENPTGYVNLTFLEDEDDNKWKNQVGERLPKIIEELQDRGVALKDIAILVHKHKYGKLAADYLSIYEDSAAARADCRYDVVSNESLYLVSSSAIRTILAAIQYLHDSSDLVITAQLIYEYQRNVKNSTDELHHWFHSASLETERTQYLPERFVEQQSTLIYLPFYEMVEMMIDIFDVNKIKGQYAYLQTFQDLTLKFTQNEKGDITTFLSWWAERAHKESIKVPDDLDAIRILTIHKAKGLEFKSVILPFCDWGIDHNTQPQTTIWSKAEEEPFNQAHLPVSYSGKLTNTHYAKHYEEERIKAHLDNLNVLYVAFTRAVHNLWVFAPVVKKGIAHAVNTTLESQNFDLNAHWNEENKVFEFGNRDFQFDKNENKETTGITLSKYQHYNWRKKITIRQSAQGIINESETRAKINYGILMHKLLSDIETAQDKPRAIKALYYEEGLNDEQKAEIEKLIDQLLANDTARSWFTPEWKVYNEMSIITPTEEHRPDRVIMRKNEAVIIDYKTGFAKSADKRQMHQYIDLLQTMGHENVKGYLWYLAENEVIEI